MATQGYQALRISCTRIIKVHGLEVQEAGAGYLGFEYLLGCQTGEQAEVLCVRLFVEAMLWKCPVCSLCNLLDVQFSGVDSWGWLDMDKQGDYIREHSSRLVEPHMSSYSTC
jgi:hypothetical protein